MTPQGPERSCHGEYDSTPSMRSRRAQRNILCAGARQPQHLAVASARIAGSPVQRNVLSDADTDRPLGPKPPFLRDIPATELLDAKLATAEFLTASGFPESDEEIEADAARSVFQTLTSTGETESSRRKALALLETPESVRHLVAMLVQYDYTLIAHADEIRNKLIAGLLEECDDPDPRVRLKAYELTGKIKEVALFEERVAVRKETLSDEELDAKIRERVNRLKELAAPAAKPAEEPIDVIFKEVK